jgi:DNA repair exonuclease SbcCD nuclease subunit
MATTIVHAADVHLETVFPDVRGGSARRAAFAAAFERIVDLALEREADVLTIGGDLYESERAGPATARFLFAAFARFGKPVFIAPGNHDPYGAASLYARNDVPPNVHVFSETAWRAYPLGAEITLFGFGHTAAEPGRPFRGAAFDRGGVQIALVHGSDEERCPPNKRATAPFTQAEIIASGASLLLTGHYHGGYVASERKRPVFAYPGSPEPIKAGERGTHGALVVTVTGSAISCSQLPIARTRAVDCDCDVTDASSEPAVLAALERTLAGFGPSDYVRVRLTGTVPAGTRIDRELIADRFGENLGALTVDDATVAADYAALALEPTVRGRVIRELLEIARTADVARAADADRALRLCAAAFEAAEIAP